MKAIKYFSFGLLSAFALSACSDKFLEEKKNYDNATTDIYNYLSGCNGRVNDIYSWCLPKVSDLTTGQNYLSVSIGNADIAAKSTEEYTGFSDFVNPEIELTSMGTTNAVPDYFLGANANIQNSVYGRIRNINDCINGIQGGSISDEDKQLLLGQVYFFRAWCYYNLVKWYGGVPIVTDVLEPVESSFTPRSSTKDCIEFILADLDRAATMLAGKVWSGSDYGRVTAGTALALKGRVLLLWASPLFNRANDQTRWQNAYTQMKADLSVINACGYGLYTSGNNVNGSDFARQFLVVNANPEAVFVALHNNVMSDEGLDNQKNNTWEGAVRPKNTGGSGKGAGLALVDLFPMKDGKIANLGALTTARTYANTYSKLERSKYLYDETAPYMNRDPRFYRTFAFPGTEWQFLGSITGDLIEKCPYGTGLEYQLQNYAWYTTAEEAADQTRSGYFTDLLAGSGKSIYVRKKSQDYGLGVTPMYVFDSEQGFARNGVPLIAMRYTEVLLNYAEAACGANHLDEAWNALIKIRQRVGYEGDCGLDPAIRGDRAKMFEAILYERRIELAYEGKRFDDCHRWMLFDGGTNQENIEGAPATWNLTGFGGNTCQWLGVTMLNNVHLHCLEMHFDPAYFMGAKSTDVDPFTTLGISKPKALKLTEDFTTTIDEETGEAVYADANVQALAQFYGQYLVRKDIVTQTVEDADGEYASSRWTKKCYLMGLQSADEENNPNVVQTIGWNSTFGGMGVFDPLSDNPQTTR